MSELSSIGVRAPGKAMLIGEYAVLDGAPAVVAAVDCYAVGRLLPPGQEPASPFITAAGHEAAALFAELGATAPAAWPVPVVDTQAFSRGGRKLGVGSSAAATVAAVGALLAGGGVELERPEVRALVQRAATRAHDAAQGVRGSGADIAAATWGGLTTLNDAAKGAAAAPALPVLLRFVATSSSVSTAALVGRYREVGALAAPATAALAEAAARFIAAWRAGDGPALLQAVAAAYAGYQALERALERSLITDEHAAIAAAARRAGGVAKPSGAGGGDLAVVFLPDEEAAARLMRELPPALRPLALQVSPQGLHTVSEN